ncbi:proline-rich protein 29-like isoform X2 [Channa argus]|uniref:proline-rich protein 29-like isoform X2 n=1 Tax=Channa argus TaxID=215402 RepID=UPI003521F908
MAWTEDIYPHVEPYDPHTFEIFSAPQQPYTILQHLPATMMPPSLAPSIRPGGHVKEDLVELMMIQNAQIHQVIMNNMTMSALRLFGCSGSPLGTKAPRDLVIIQENEAEPEIYHHYYQPVQYMPCPPWLLPQATLFYPEDPNKPSSAQSHRDRPVVAPPLPLTSTSGTVGAIFAATAERTSTAEAKAEKKKK